MNTERSWDKVTEEYRKMYSNLRKVSDVISTTLVTGGSGFIGTHLCRYLQDLGHYVISSDIMHTDSHPWECITADIRDNLQFDGIDYIVLFSSTNLCSSINR